jgi:hypothetical protein
MFGALLLIAFCLGMTPSPAGDVLSDVELLARAEQAFRTGVAARTDSSQARHYFGKAASDYEILRQRGYRSSALFGNQGNAYFLAGDWPGAILAFQRGLRLDGGNRQIQAHLDHARSQVVSPFPPVRGLLPWLPRWHSNRLLVAAIGCYGVACLAWTRWWMIRQSRLWKAAVGAMLIGMVAAANWGLEAWEDQQNLKYPLVVIAEDGVKLRNGNGSSYPAYEDATLNRGVEARMVFSRGNWLQIELAGGKLGWVPRAAALVDGP